MVLIEASEPLSDSLRVVTPAALVLPDSLDPRTYPLQEMVVTSARVLQTSSQSPANVTIFSREEIESINATSLAQIVSPATGIFVKDYGSTSGLKTISQRGLGTEHTLILLNGLRVSSLQNGLVDLGMVPVDNIESVEIVRGGQSALYGADAVAGLINVITKPPPGRNDVRVLSSLGSCGYSRFQATANLSAGNDGIRVSYGEERSDGNFPFTFRSGTSLVNRTRQNADLLARYAGLSGGLEFNQEISLTLVANTYSSERGVPGAVVSQFSSARARQTDRDHLLQASLLSEVTERVRLTIAGQFHSAYEQYRDPGLNIGGTSLDTYFRNNDIRIEPRVDMVVTDRVRLTSGTELVHVSAEGNSLAKDITRRQAGTFIAGEVVLLKTDGAVSDVVLFPALRNDISSTMTPVWSPQLGMRMGFQEFDAGEIKRINFALRSTVSRNFRAPTFNELYFSGGGGHGNPTLLPERSTSFDAGGSVKFLLAGEHHAQVTYFLNDMSDRIVWSPTSGNAVVPKNLRRVRSEGFETSYRWQEPGRVLTLQAGYTTSNTRKTSMDYAGDPAVNTQLVFIPHETLSLSAGVSLNPDGPILKELACLMGYAFVGYRYYTEDNTDFLPSHHVVNAALKARLAMHQLSLLAKMEINNLFNEEYQVMLGYPMPLRSYRLTLSLEYR